jgi:hypothetical protein
MAVLFNQDVRRYAKRIWVASARWGELLERADRLVRIARAHRAIRTSDQGRIGGA